MRHKHNGKPEALVHCKHKIGNLVMDCSDISRCLAKACHQRTEIQAQHPLASRLRKQRFDIERFRRHQESRIADHAYIPPHTYALEIICRHRLANRNQVHTIKKIAHVTLNHRLSRERTD